MRAYLRVLAMVATPFALFACADRTEERAETADEPRRGGTAVLAEQADLGIPSPVVAQVQLDGDLTQDVLYMALLRGRWRDGQLVYLTSEESPMALARGYEFVGSDSTVLRFRMRADARWSDGEPITARDVAYTYRVTTTPEVAAARAGDLAQLDSVVAENDSTVAFHYQRRYPEMLAHSSLAIIPRHQFMTVEAAELRDHPALQDPVEESLVVSGPFMISEWRRGERIVLGRNPEFRPEPYLDRIVLRILPDANSRLIELQNGDADFVKGVPFDRIPELLARPDLRIEHEEQRNYEFIGYSGDNFAPFADPELRRALGLAIDVPGIISALGMDDFAEPAGGPYAPIFRDLYDRETMPPLGHDAAESRRILESKGWVDGDGDGVREKDGTPLRFSLLTNAGNQRRADVMQIVERQWREVGVDVELRTLETGAFFERFYAGDFEAALGGWIVGLSPDIAPLFRSDSPYNITAFDDPRTDSLLDQARSEPTAEAAAARWREAARAIVEQQPYTFLYYYDVADAISDRLQGVRVDTYGNLQNTWEWWVTEDRTATGARADSSGSRPGDG